MGGGDGRARAAGRRVGRGRLRRASLTAATVVVVAGSLPVTTGLAVAPAGATAPPDRVTALVSDIWPGERGNVTPPVALGDLVLFGADDGEHGSELWASDGTEAGTRLVKDVVPGELGSHPSELTVVGEEVFFAAGAGLWVTDGTAEGTRLVGYTGSAAAVLEELTAVGDTLFLTAFVEDAGSDLWTSDGTTLTQVRELPGDEHLDPTGLVDVDGTLFFQGRDPEHGAELWTSDGTSAGTRLVADVAPDAHGSHPSELTAVGDLVYFAAADATSGTELWRSDGTEAGTVQVQDIAPGPGSSSPSGLVAAGSALYFAADDGGLGRELWRSDGTSGGTTLVRDIHAGAEGSSPEDLHAVGTQVWFSAADAAHGRELWRSDGTAQGTALVKDIRHGPASSNPNEFADLDGTLFFAADDGWYGAALWRSDGAAVDTEMVADVTDDAFAGRPTDLTPLGHALFFVVDDAEHGYELWRTAPAPLVNLVLPRIDIRGAPRVGSVLSGTTGLWNAADPRLTYRWFIGKAPTPAGTTRRFRVPAAAVGQRVTLRVTASATGRSATATSNATDWVVPGTQRLVRRPAVVGRKAVGRLLRASPGATRPASSVRRFQWLRNGAVIRRATRATYRLAPRDRGTRISVRVTRVRPGYRPLIATSPRTTRIPR